MGNDPFGWLGGIGGLGAGLGHLYGYQQQASLADMERQMMEMQARLSGGLAERQRSLDLAAGLTLADVMLPLDKYEEAKSDWSSRWKNIVGEFDSEPSSSFLTAVRRPWWTCNPWLITCLVIVIEIWRITNA